MYVCSARGGISFTDNEDNFFITGKLLQLDPGYKYLFNHPEVL